ncbi:hypothetical protein PtA15_15A294 [Puccinia triticina]|uniref:PAS domain-containing protein n=1 Tax=Puccinia triticina TaxID=208348 RepID=A0ABY7D6D8_9BASI|nr:uncharacterized protein PtA15_15A294 [Puccinia triticina]WAQ91901.1 hypothetical protein PtA15_15A294 [Puccinia triticina]
MATCGEDDYQQRIDPALRSCQMPTSLSTPPPTPSSKNVPAEYHPQQEGDGPEKLPPPNPNSSDNIHQQHPPAHHDSQPPIRPIRTSLAPIQTNHHRSSSYTASTSSSQGSSSGSNPSNIPSSVRPTTYIPRHLSAPRTRPTPSTSLQDLHSPAKHPYSLPIPTSYLQNSLKSPASFSTDHQTIPTTASQDSGGKEFISHTYGGKSNTTSPNNALEFGEQWMLNHQHGPSEEDAKPIDKISAELDYSFKRLINLDVFRQVLEDPASRRAFRQAIIQGLSFSSTPSTLSLTKLDLWLDCRGVNQILNLLKIGTNGLIDVYLRDADSRQALNAILPEPSVGGIPSSLLKSINRLKLLENEEENDYGTATTDEQAEMADEFDQPQGIGLKAVENRLLMSLYRNEFPLFIKQNLVSTVVVKLGKFNLNETDRDGLGDCFCLTNPRLRDHPIVLVSEGFTKVTGYERDAIVGKNCRFLQGPGTSPESVQRIRDGLNSGEGCTELLLNYRKDGTPFYCLLCIIPFRDVTGALIYFIGGQINVTGMLSDKQSLSFLMGNSDPNGHALARSSARSAGRSADDLLDHVGLSRHSFSPTMQQFALTGRMTSSGSEQTSSSKGENVEGSDARGNTTGGEYHAAGSIIMDGFEPTPAKENPTLRTGGPMGFFRRLAGFNHCEPHANFAQPYPPTSSSKKASQKLIGAEALFHEPKPLSDQIKSFESTYSHLLVFQRDSRRVIFATKEVINLFGLTHSTTKEIYKSKLIQIDFLELVWPLTPTIKESVANLRAHLKKIIKTGLPISVDCQVKSIERGFFSSITREEDLSKLVLTKIHLTPLMDKDGKSVAYVCLFG